MKLELSKYKEQLDRWPKEGYHIMAQYDDEKIIVYQAYRPAIGHFARDHQFFGGKFSLNRMTWIKPNFLWMMYRSGWGQKEGQEVVLAIHLKKEAFFNYLKQVVYSSFDPDRYEDQESWKNAVKESSARLQWDPDHNPYGEKITRKAIQIGLRKELIASYAKEDVLEIEDISPFVNEQYEHIKNKDLDSLMTPAERPLIVEDQQLHHFLKLNT